MWWGIGQDIVVEMEDQLQLKVVNSESLSDVDRNTIISFCIFVVQSFSFVVWGEGAGAGAGWGGAGWAQNKNTFFWISGRFRGF